ncbi:Short-chain dehydrogenase [Sphingomonas sp. EC-HK361]|uniref:SDR family oxidoreductase n=1 Tax=Sphingomonas sp. EC-HK361 TaxID=2038397 RepID=UPI001251892C|nr:SDR family oxidoreductase [Sphingomonas sp. EC-HK361]VVT13450.1 Short-chain dehydrogenase [Sphingomonas sp. EC-HK361]
MHLRTVLVTGGAKRLGAEIARALAAAGHGVVIHYGRSSEAAEALAREIGALGAVRADLANGGEVDALIARAGQVAGRPIDGLVNSASEFTFDAPPDPDPVLLERLYAVNCVAPVRLACALARQDGIGSGSVVNLLDQKLANPNPDFFSYSLAKFALAGATTMLAQALGPRVAVNAVAPGITLPSGGQSESEFHAVAAGNLLRRPVDPQDVARAVAYLIGAWGVRGQTLYVDCGQRFVPSARDVMFEDADG